LILLIFFYFFFKRQRNILEDYLAQGRCAKNRKEKIQKSFKKGATNPKKRQEDLKPKQPRGLFHQRLRS